MSTMRRSKGGMMQRDLTREVGFALSERVHANTTDAEKQKIAFEEYLKNTMPPQGPLHDLPSPPLTHASSRNSGTTSPAQHHVNSIFEGMDMESRYRGAAIHLANLIPSTATFSDPSIPLIQRIIIRSELPFHTIALAACILDALPFRFGRTWRNDCPRSQPPSNPKRHTLSAPPPNFEDFTRDPVTFDGQTREHARSASLDMNYVPTEIIVLCALAIAEKFTIDAPNEPSSYYLALWADNEWDVRQFNTTERCIMQCLNYKILHLCDEELIKEAVDSMAVSEKWHDREMRRASKRSQTNILTPPSSGPASDDERDGPPRTHLHRSRPLV